MVKKQAKKKKGRSGSSLPRIGDQILTALTQKQIAHLLNALFEVSPPDSREKALAQLQPDTRQTVLQILSPPRPASQTKATRATPVSMAKQAQTWSKLWDEWYALVAVAVQEEGEYIAQEGHGEPPYFDETAFVEDLEKLAGKMRPQLQTAFQNSFSPDDGFAQALLAATKEVAAALPDWMGTIEGFFLEGNLTNCLLEWEWLATVAAGQDAFAFARRIRAWEHRASHVSLNDEVFPEFFTKLPEEEQQTVFEGLNRHKTEVLWEDHLENTYSHWHALYMYWIDRFTPEQYLVELRATIEQQWENGLPVMEEYLKKENYQESLAVIRETILAMEKGLRGAESWTPDGHLLFAQVSHFYPQSEYLRSYKTLLRHYQKTARGLGDTHLENALRIQHLAFNHFFDWQRMFKAFDESALPESTCQTLFQSWRDHVVERTRPDSWQFGRNGADQRWWVPWLIESIADPQKGAAYFEKEVSGWLKALRLSKEEDRSFGYLRLLTKDLTELAGRRRKNPYPQFYQVVIRPGELSTPDGASRRKYLKGLVPGDLLETVMGFWKEHLAELVPSPREASKSDYTRHAQWMAALQELAPRAYSSLLSQWRVDHERRRNLWKAMEERGLE